MPSGGQLGSGVKIGFAVGSPHTWITVPEVRDVPQLPNRERDRVESTVHGVTSERSYIPGLADVRDLEFVLRANLDAGSVHMQIKALEVSQAVYWWRVEAPVDPTLATSTYVAWTFQGRVSLWDMTAPIDGLKEISVTVQYNANLMFQEEGASVLS